MDAYVSLDLVNTYVLYTWYYGELKTDRECYFEHVLIANIEIEFASYLSKPFAFSSKLEKFRNVFIMT